MSERVAATAALWSLVVAAWASLLAFRGRAPTPALAAGAVLLQLTLAAQAVGSLAAWTVGGSGPALPAEHGGYLAASVLVLPLAWAYGRGAGARGHAAVVAAACAALAVVCVRLAATWRR